MKRFFFRPDERSGDKVVLSEMESKHIRTVLRLKIGDTIELLDGLGSVFTAKIVSIEKCVTVQIITLLDKEQQTEGRICLGQGLLKSKKMDLIVQKCTELGVDSFMPFVGERSQGRPDELQMRKKHERWGRIVEESCKQCSRSRPMKVWQASTFEEMISLPETDVLKLLCWEGEFVTSFRNIPPLEGYDLIHVLLGPEGGFTQEEIEQAQGLGWITVTLGPLILRAETAAISSVSILQYLRGII